MVGNLQRFQVSTSTNQRFRCNTADQSIFQNSPSRVALPKLDRGFWRQLGLNLVFLRRNLPALDLINESNLPRGRAAEVVSSEHPPLSSELEARLQPEVGRFADAPSSQTLAGDLNSLVEE